MLETAAVLFDLDDTLLDAEAAWREGIATLLAARAPEVALENAITAWDHVFPAWFERYLTGEITLEESRGGRIREWAPMVGVDVPPGEELAWFDSYVVGYERGWTQFPDVAPALAALAPLPLGVVTNGDSRQQRDKVAALGLADTFAVVMVSADLGIAKPDPALFLAAADRLGVAPDACVMVGDRLDRDVTGALAAGMRAVWLRRPGGPDAHLTPPAELAGSITVIDSLHALPALVGRAEAG